MSPAGPETPAPRTWPRLLIAELLQLVPLAVVLFGRAPLALWVGGAIGSAICCAATDSGWRWRNRLLIAQAVLWLLVPLVFAIP